MTSPGAFAPATLLRSTDLAYSFVGQLSDGIFLPAQNSFILAKRKWPYQMCVWEHNDIAVVSPQELCQLRLGKLVF